MPKVKPRFGSHRNVQIPITVENTTWISAIRAHALMFLGRVDEARVFYLIFQSNRRFVMTLWETAILQDFVQLRKAGHSHPLMDQIEKRFADQGWTTERGNKQVLRPVMSGQDRLFVDSHPITSNPATCWTNTTSRSGQSRYTSVISNAARPR